MKSDVFVSRGEGMITIETSEDWSISFPIEDGEAVAEAILDLLQDL